ncbi:MAG: hypothetical protein Q4B85_03405 [Lachnospiraceae bacterium]|nr:hypothetical protein [Lachnospiraceae bacterium]
MSKEELGGISISSVLLDQGDLGSILAEKGVEERELLTVGNYEGAYLRYFHMKSDHSFNQSVYLLCPDLHRVLILDFSEDLSKEDVIQFTQGLTITETEELYSTEGLLTWKDYVQPDEPITSQWLEVSDKDLPVFPWEKPRFWNHSAYRIGTLPLPALIQSHIYQRLQILILWINS